MKKASLLCAGVLICSLLVACGGTAPSPASGTPSEPAATVAPTPTPTPTPVPPPDLTGEWKEVDGNSEDNYMIATISGDTIEVDWCLNGGDTIALYWAGSFAAPETADEPYTWESQNDKERTSSALMASGDDTKVFTYQDGTISFSLTAMGVTTTVKMAQQ